MAFSADELRVIRRALAIALHPVPVPAAPSADGLQCSEEVRECLRLAEAVDEAVREGRRLRSFLLADLARYRSALPGSAAGYLEQLEDALAAGYLPRPDDLAALRALCACPTGATEAGRRSALLARCERLAELSVRSRLTSAVVPDARSAPRLTALPGGRAADEKERPAKPRPSRPAEPAKPARPAKPSEPAKPAKPSEPAKPAKPDRPTRSDEPKKPAEPKEPPPARPVPTPAEVFPPRRPARPPEDALPA